MNVKLNEQQKEVINRLEKAGFYLTYVRDKFVIQRRGHTVKVSALDAKSLGSTHMNRKVHSPEYVSNHMRFLNDIQHIMNAVANQFANVVLVTREEHEKIHNLSH